MVELFSRLTHSHPGRIVWLVFNVSIALLLMEIGVFGALEKVLGLFSNISIAWISEVAAELASIPYMKSGRLLADNAWSYPKSSSFSFKR